MAVMDRRFQVLLDEARYARIAGEAERTGRSVGALIRDAIDVCYPAGDETRIRVAGELLALSTTPESAPGEGPDELKSAWSEHLDRKLA